MPDRVRPIEILVVEDNPGDVRLIREALAESKILNTIVVAQDGEEALRILAERRPSPDLVLLDLNLPRLDGHEVLARIKSDEATKAIPVVILTTSRSSDDILKSYREHANCLVTKPLDIQQFGRAVRSVENFWFSIVTLPEVTGN